MKLQKPKSKFQWEKRRGMAHSPDRSGLRAEQNLPAKHEKPRGIVKRRVLSCLNRVSHRVIFRRNRALSCYIVLKIRDLFFDPSKSAPKALKVT